MQTEFIIYAFIDSQNVNLSVRDQGWALDFKRFRQYLKDKYRVKQAFLFIGYIKDNEGMYKADIDPQGWFHQRQCGCGAGFTGDDRMAALR